MLLPRPARLIRQRPLLSRSDICSARFLHSSTPKAAPRIEIIEQEYAQIDDDQAEVVQLRRQSHTRRRRDLVEGVPQSVVESEILSISSRIGDRDAEGKPRSPFGLARDDSGEMEDEEAGSREARTSPAAILGSKRLELALLPSELSNGIIDAVSNVDPKMVRQQYLRLQELSLKAPEDRKRPRTIEPEMAVASAAAFLPGEYAAVRNVLEEMDRRLGKDWLDRAAYVAHRTHLAEESTDGVQAMERTEAFSAENNERIRPRVFEASASLGPGLWAMMDNRGLLESAREDGAEERGPVDYQLYHGPSHTKSMANRLAKVIPESSVSLDLPPKLDRSFISTTPALTLSTFFLSTLPESARRKHLRALLAFKSPYIIIVDHARRDGWDAISKAREYILSTSTPEAPLHIVAPCPHDQECPLKGGREICGFSQRHQAPSFLRKTKHSKRGQEDKKYVYLVVGRGERPNPLFTGGDLWEIGRMGGVAKDQARKNVEKMQGKSVLREIEGSEEGDIQYEMVPLKEIEEEKRLAEGEPEPVDFANVDETQMMQSLREEAYSWPRLVAPPIKSSGHVIMDVCAQSGEIERMTIPKSHSKQGYHDARKSFWGDIFPHEPKGKTIPRPRGVKRLMSEAEVEDEQETGAFWDEVFGLEPGETLKDMQESKAKQGEEGWFEITDSARGRKHQTAQEKKDAQRAEAARLDKLYSKTRPEHFDDFPLDAPPKDWKLKRGDKVGEHNDREKRKMRENRKEKARAEKTTVRKEQPGSDMWDQGPSIFELIAQRQGQVETSVPPAGRSDVGGKRSFGTLAQSRVGLGLTGGSFTQKRHMSVRPAEKAGRPKVTIAELSRLKAEGTPISVLTAYDFPTSLLSEAAGMDMTLVGDSLSQVALGHETTTAITLDEMIHHCKAVTRGAKTPFVFADVPFGSFESSTEKGVESTIRLVKEGGVDGVKIEGGREIIPLVERLGSMGLAVIPHLGLQPQRATSTSGYLVQGRSAQSAQELLQTALDLEKAGATAILLEAIPHLLAGYITERLAIPTIGIGAGPHTSGQVLVVTDVLGTYAPDEPAEGEEGGGKKAAGQPRFVRQFGDVGRASRRAIEDYKRAVKGREFPEVRKETYGMNKDEWEAFLQQQQQLQPAAAAGQ